MPTTLSVSPVERGTCFVDASFFDENDDPMTPNNDLVWTLTDARGAVINDREEVSITPDETVTIVLSGLDLAIAPTEGVAVRKLLFEGTYNSDLGNNLPFKDEVTFTITNFVRPSGLS